MSTEQDNATIRARDNGPLVVSKLTRLSNSKGEALAVEETIALCRCGGSANKPFCDGSHRNNGFSDQNLRAADADHRESYAGKRITVHDNRSVCSHAGKCTDGLASVWRMGQEPWIDPDGAAVEDIIAVIAQCPSGALSYTLESVETHPEPAQTGISIEKNGPYRVTGSIELTDASWGKGASTRRYALCRCGQSKNKPFCDGSHWAAGFTDDAN